MDKQFDQSRTLQLQAKPIKLQLKRSFNTAHSSSTTRTNFLIKTTLTNCDFLSYQNVQSHKNNLTGFGQCGLPPKKPFCYLADINDCQQFFAELLKNFQGFISQLQSDIKSINFKLEEYLINKLKQLFNQAFHGLILLQKIEQQPIGCQFFKQKVTQLMSSVQTSKQNLNQIYFFLQVFYLFKQSHKLSQQNPTYKAATSALQFSLLDLIGQVYTLPVSQLISKSQKDQGQNFSFYTISHEEDLESMVQNGKDSLKFTNCIKIKFSNEIDKLISLLQQLHKQNIGNEWIIDANACWSPQNYIHFQESFKKLVQQDTEYGQKLLFIQQPFPIFKSMTTSKTVQQIQLQQKKWQDIKKTTSLIIIADESFASFDDLEKVKKYSHGINIKMQKCGGPLQALKVLKAIKNDKIELMFGSMVSTHLGCTQTFQFYKFAKYFDIDGALLVKQPQITGGFQWQGQKGIEKVVGNGLALSKHDIFKLC